MVREILLIDFPNFSLSPSQKIICTDYRYIGYFWPVKKRINSTSTEVDDWYFNGQWWRHLWWVLLEQISSHVIPSFSFDQVPTEQESFQRKTRDENKNRDFDAAHQIFDRFFSTIDAYIRRRTWREGFECLGFCSTDSKEYLREASQNLSTENIARI